MSYSPFEVSNSNYPESSFPETLPINVADPIIIPPNMHSPSKNEYKIKTELSSNPATPEKRTNTSKKRTNIPEKIKTTVNTQPLTDSSNPLKSNYSKKESEQSEINIKNIPISPFQREKKGKVGKVRFKT